MLETTDPTLLLTRPLKASQRLAQELNAHHIVISPLLELEFVTDALPDKLPQNLILTSKNGVNALQRSGKHQGQNAWCVGATTAKAAKKAGLKVQHIAQTAQDLLKCKFPDAPLLHISGEHRRGDIITNLQQRGHDAAQITAYKQHARPFSLEAQALLLSGVKIVAPIYSPRTAVLFAKSCPQRAWKNLTLVCISKAASFPFPKSADCRIAEIPTASDMKTAIIAALSPEVRA